LKRNLRGCAAAFAALFGRVCAWFGQGVSFRVSVWPMNVQERLMLNGYDRIRNAFCSMGSWYC
jgi:hypothetical protein